VPQSVGAFTAYVKLKVHQRVVKGYFSVPFFSLLLIGGANIVVSSIKSYNLHATCLELVSKDTSTDLHVMPETTLLADSLVDIAKKILGKMPCKWGDCESVLNCWEMVKEVWIHYSIKFLLGRSDSLSFWLRALKSGGQRHPGPCLCAI